LPGRCAAFHVGRDKKGLPHPNDRNQKGIALTLSDICDTQGIVALCCAKNRLGEAAFAGSSDGRSLVSWHGRDLADRCDLSYHALFVRKRGDGDGVIS